MVACLVVLKLNVQAVLDAHLHLQAKEPHALAALYNQTSHSTCLMFPLTIAAAAAAVFCFGKSAVVRRCIGEIKHI